MPYLFDVLRDALAARYGVQREVGRGGMATVFLADDVKHRRPVAIKVLHPELAAAVGADRFLREIETAARLQHPHILPLYDSGSAAGFLYYVMPYVEGESLRDRLTREKQLPLDDAVRIAVQVASALSYAHVHGVVHRDIKPENIMLSAGTAVVADFGIARAVTPAGDQRLTDTGTVIGTPAYMSPEQATGSADIDGRSDQYSLACVVYEMLVGHPPFLGTSVQEILARHTLDAVSPPSVARAAIPDAVENAILRALEKVPPDRFPTATLFAEALTEPSPASKSRRRTRRGMSVRRSRGWRRAAVIGGVLLAVAASALVIWPPWGSAPEGGLDPRRIAVRYFEDLSTEKNLGYLADGLTEALIDQLAPIPSLQVISKHGVAAYRRSDIARDSIARALGVGSLIEGSVEEAGDRVRVTVRLVDAASGADIDRKSFERARGEVLRVRDDLAQQVAGFLRQRLGQEIRVRQQKAGTQNVAAWVLVQQAERSRKDADALAKDGDMTGSTRELQRADSLSARAEAADPAWVEPIVLRGLIAYQRSRAKGPDPIAAAPFISEGLMHAGRALQGDQNNPRALELRGTLRYWRWLLRLEADPAGAATLFQRAEQDLRSAVKLEPGLAGAWSTLSHLDYQKPDVVQAKLDAYRAYEADAYLAAADVILWRLFTSSYDLEQFVDARHWCDEGGRRFPTTTRFVQCQLWIMTAPIEPPDVARAWQLLDELRALTPEQDWALGRLEAQTVVAAVLARAGLADSARRLLLRSRGNADVDPTHELVINEAFVRTLLGDRDDAMRLLQQLVAAQPERREELAKDSQWWFRDLRSDPRYQDLAGIRR